LKVWSFCFGGTSLGQAGGEEILVADVATLVLVAEVSANPWITGTRRGFFIIDQ